MSLFENFGQDPNVTNTIDLWDIAPRFVFYTDADAREAGKYLRTIERDFMHAGKHYSLVLKPARIKRDGKEIEEYPGEREQLVEEVIRKLAVERGRLGLDKQENVIMRFSLTEVRRELERTKHGFKFDQIKEAIRILRQAEVEILKEEGEGGQQATSVLVSSAFPQIGFREKGREDADTFVQFNWLVATALKHLEFRQMNYELIMRLKKPMARWLFKRLYHNVIYPTDAFANPALHVIHATEIHRDCGMSQWSRWRDALRHIDKAVEVLKAEGVLDSVETEAIHKGRTKEDVIYTMRASPGFLAQAGRAERLHHENLADFRNLTGFEEPKEFIPINPVQVAELRRGSQAARPRPPQGRVGCPARRGARGEGGQLTGKMHGDWQV